MNTTDLSGKTTWFDLPVHDPVNARSFYEGLFGWRFLLMKDSAVPDYWVIQAGEDLIGGLREVREKRAEGASAPILYFTVNDLNQTTARIKELGGTLVGGAVDLGLGRGHYQFFKDREGTMSAIWAPTKSVAKGDSK